MISASYCYHTYNNTIFLYGVFSIYTVFLIVPPPIVTMSAPDEQTVGQSLTLECRIAAVKDIDSTVDIIWTTGSTEVRRVENIPACLISNYSDFFTIPVLSRNDNNREYQCEVIINISPPVTGNNSITLNVTRKF